MKYLPLAGVVVLGLAAVCKAAEYRAGSAADVAKLSLKAGDVVILNDGEWKDQAIVVKGKGAEGRPIVVKAQTPGKVILTGTSGVVLDGDYLELSGVFLKGIDRDGNGDGIAVPGNHCRVTECAVVGGGTKFFVHLIGVENRVDHCYLAEKTTSDPTFQIEVHQDVPNNDRVDHNHFGHRPPLGKNGGETMRIGYSGQSQWNSRAVVEHNLYERCDGEIEIISSKSCENVYRYNTFLDCAGFLTLRHGHRNVVESNFFIGHHVRGSGGVRVINEGQVIVNNYIDGVDKGAFWITAGIKDGPLTGYTRVKDAVIAFNTAVDFDGPGFELASGLGGANRTLVPEDVTIASNVLVPGKKGELITGTEGTYAWAGNVTTGPTVEGKVRHVEGRMVKGDGGLLRLDPPVAAEPVVVTGRPGPGGTVVVDKSNAGCDPATVGTPLTAKDVGPTWMTDR